MRKAVRTILLTLVVLLVSAGFALAEGPGAPMDASRGLIALAGGLGVAIAGFGAALGQGRAVAAAMESIGRNPNAAANIQTPMIIGIAFIEALAIYAFVIAFLLQGKL